MKLITGKAKEKDASLSNGELHELQMMYSKLYDSAELSVVKRDHKQVTSIEYLGETFSEEKRHCKRTSIIRAKWLAVNGYILDSTEKLAIPGTIEKIILHDVQVRTTSIKHILFKVRFYEVHPDLYKYGMTSILCHKIEKPFVFIPMQRFASRCAIVERQVNHVPAIIAIDIPCKY